MSRPLSLDLPRLRRALLATQGNLTRAALRLGVSKVYIINLVRDVGLREWARELRVASGAPATGKPPARERLQRAVAVEK